MHWSGHWEKESLAARSVLEQLYTDGILLIHHKTGSRKYYDLAEKYLPADLLNAPNPFPDEASLTDWRVRRRIGAVGMLWNRNSTAWLGISMTTEQRTAAFARLEKNGSITAVQVEGIRFPMYLLSEDLPLLESVTAGQADTKARLEFLAPLDRAISIPGKSTPLLSNANTAIMYSPLYTEIVSSGGLNPKPTGKQIRLQFRMYGWSRASGKPNCFPAK